MEINDEVIQTVENLEFVLQDVSELMTPLREYHAIYATLFGRREHHEHSEFYMKGLLSPEVERKSIEPMVLHLKGANENAVRAVQQVSRRGELARRSNPPAPLERSGDNPGRRRRVAHPGRK